MNEKSLDWSDLRLFLEVAREGGLSAAASSAAKSAATLSRRMLALERSLGKALFVRHAQGYSLTQEGAELLESLADVEAKLVRLFADDTTDVAPLIKISAGTWTTMALIEHLDTLAGDPADVRFRFVSTEKMLSLPRREITFGFRNAPPTDPTLIGRKLKQVEFAPYARADAPRKWIVVLGDTPSSLWLQKHQPVDVSYQVSSPRNSLDLALAGKGVALLPTFIGDRQSALQRTGGTIADLAHDQWLVFHQQDRDLPEVRRLLDRIYQIFEVPRLDG